MDYDDRGLAAMPKLVGGPKYSRPPSVVVSTVDRPPDPDDLPLFNERTPEDHALAQTLGIDAAAQSADGVAVTSAAATSDSGSRSAGGSSAGASRKRGFGRLFRGGSGRTG